jgi:TolB protein
VTRRGGLPHDIPLDYSPDGKRLVFYRAVKAEPDFPTDLGGSLWVVNADGSGLRRIETGANPPAWWARWSADGRRIVFATQRTAPQGALWTADVDGLAVTKLFEDKEGRFPIQPTWSPDARHVMFALDPINDAFTHPANGLFVIKADGHWTDLDQRYRRLQEPARVVAVIATGERVAALPSEGGP